MDVKRIFGILLTIGGLVGLISAAVIFMNTSAGVYNIKLICVYGILGLIFFITGIGLIQSTKDKS